MHLPVSVSQTFPNVPQKVTRSLVQLAKPVLAITVHVSHTPKSPQLQVILTSNVPMVLGSHLNPNAFQHYLAQSGPHHVPQTRPNAVPRNPIAQHQRHVHQV